METLIRKDEAVAAKVLTKRAFERAAQQTLDLDEMVKIVKKEVGKEMEKRFICGGLCLTGLFVALGSGVIASSVISETKN